ncbi:MAG TPA: hypothetical protein VKS60_26270 [Stellaceae bacterium]|nr:hypothetical protein [Stellaceae bacterium]
MLWLILVLAVGLSVPALVVAVKEVTGDPVPEINPLFIGGLVLFLPPDVDAFVKRHRPL